MACSTEVRQLRVVLKTPEAPDPLQEVETLQLSITGPEGYRKTVRGSVDGNLVLPDVAVGQQRMIEVVAFGASEGEPLASGRSLPFDLSDTQPAEVSIYLARVDAFSRLRASLATPRNAHSATVLDDGRVLIAGGFDSDGNSLASVEIYDPIARSLTAGPSLATPRGRHVAVGLGEKHVLFVGGRNQHGSDSQVLSDAELYSAEEGVLRTYPIETNPFLLFNITATRLDDGKVLIVGRDRVQLLDPSRPSGPLPDVPLPDPQRIAHIAVKLTDGRVFIACGEESAEVQTKTSAFFDPKRPDDPWSAGPKAPAESARGVATILADGSVLISGGNDAPLTQRFDPTTSKWQRIDTTEARALHAMAPVGNGALIAGASAGAEFYEDGRLRAVHPMLESPERSWFSLTPLPGGDVLAVGGEQGKQVLGDIQIFRPHPKRVSATLPETTDTHADGSAP